MVFYKWSTVSQKLEMTNSPYFHSGFGTPLADDPENYKHKGSDVFEPNVWNPFIMNIAFSSMAE